MCQLVMGAAEPPLPNVAVDVMTGLMAASLPVAKSYVLPEADAVVLGTGREFRPDDVDVDMPRPPKM